MVSEKSIEKILNARALDARTKIKVAYAFGKLKNKIPENTQARVVEKLLKLSGDRDTKVRYASVSALKNLYSGVSKNEKEKINEKLYGLCADRNAHVRFNVKELIRKINFEAKIAERIIALSKSPYPGRRNKAILIFRNTRNLIPEQYTGEVVESLSKLCSDKRLIVRMSAVQQAKYFDRVPDKTQEKLNNALLNACSDWNWIVRYGAVRTISVQRDNFRGSTINEIIGILLNLCNDAKWEIRFSAVQSLGRMRHRILFEIKDKVAAKFLQLIEKDNNKLVRAAAATSLSRLQKT